MLGLQAGHYFSALPPVPLRFGHLSGRGHGHDHSDIRLSQCDSDCNGLSGGYGRDTI